VTSSAELSDRSVFELFAFRFQFRALSNLYFPEGKAGNVVRGALGNLFRKAVCAPRCRGAKSCEQRVSCAYARLFEPTALGSGPSGLADWPRPFVFRAAHLDGRRLRPDQIFHFDLHVFAINDPSLPYFAFSFSQLMRGGLGPGSGAAELTSIHSLDRSGEACACAFDGETLFPPRLLALPLEPESRPARRITVRFLTPTELKAGGEVAREPVFSALFSRVRDRIHTLRQIYGQGPLAIDFAGLGERARAVKLLRSEIRWETRERRSGKTGQTHPLSGFTGRAEYEGELSEFLPYLLAAAWTGVGRQTTWGKGHIETTVIEWFVLTIQFILY
jgi:CRISPR-associated endoribonuclease Cas6